MKAPRPLSLSPRRRALLGAAVGLAVALAVLAVRRSDFGESLELRLVDLRTRAFAGRRAADPSIVLCQVEDVDVARVQRDLQIPWPWPLDVNAQVFGVFREAGVRAVLVDVLHLDRGQGPDDFASREPLSPEKQQELELEAGSAEAYAAALRKTKAAVVGFELHDTPAYQQPARVAVTEGRLLATGLEVPPAAPHRTGANLPVRRVAEGATALGFVNVVPDVDGVVRRAHVVGSWGGRACLSLAAAGLAVATKATPRLEEGRLHLGEHAQRLDPDGSFLVDFRGAARTTYRKVTPSKVLEWEAALRKDRALPAEAKEALSGAIVVWGVNLSGAKDILATPMGGTYDGPELQATVVDDLLHGDGRVRAPAAVDVAVLLLLGALAGAVTGASARRWVPLAALAGAAAALGAAGAWWFSRGVVLDLGAPVSAAVLAWAATTLCLLLTEGRYNKWLEGAFGRYLAPVVIDAMKKDPSVLALGGARREITILFSDVAGFSKFSRTLAPEQLVHLLNEYLTAHGDVIHAQDGVIDKFIGDAVMAFFGDPVPQPDHALRACRAALGVQAAMPALEPLWRSLGLTSFTVRIGLNSGPAVVGNMGSRRRFDYTAMGDTVNLASRLEGANKYFGSKILLGPKTYGLARDAVVARPLARLVVVGWDVPEPVYELLALREGAPADALALVDAFTRAQDAARRGDLDAADRALDDAERARPGDGPTAWFRAKVAAMRAGTEPTPWSGVLVLDAK